MKVNDNSPPVYRHVFSLRFPPSLCKITQKVTPAGNSAALITWQWRAVMTLVATVLPGYRVSLLTLAWGCPSPLDLRDMHGDVK
jgi:hypothetical protein